MHDYQTGDAHHALTQNQNRRATRGDGVLEGCQVTASDATGTVESAHDGGYCHIGGEVCVLSEDAVTHPDGDADDPRRDVVIARRTGANEASAEIIEGEPAPWSTIDSTEYRYAEAWEPQPPDTAGEDGAVLGVVTVDAGATQSSGILDTEDRRREPAPPRREPWQTLTITTPMVNLEGAEVYAHPLPIRGGTHLHVWSMYQLRFEGGSPVDWVEPANYRMEIIDPSGDSVFSRSIEQYVSDDPDSQPIGGDPDTLQPYQLEMQNQSGSDMGPDEYWGVALTASLDRRPL